ncbi:MAG: phosphoribosylglycinamide formyltransferase [Betaproteobacteria bacterium]|nr:phosphoribosylglycinamide formyltransferase [Betaproteobacteria bacterium]MDH4323747.1 phosphoribosylglycinamide formyltransferase [Betaproteobacteria bacterium]MDH5210834.1 phosphoribosylglycinamide formyltransferase [Betaproteobacteria bacterium]
MSVVVLISGRGSNLQAMLDAGIPVSAVISNRAGAGGLAIAVRHGIPTAVVEHGRFPTREAFEAALAAEIERYAPRLVALAGFMRVLTSGFVARYADRLVNIHPSLLPEFPGLDTHARALAAGAKRHGCTVHFVTEALDHGPVIAQASVPVLPGDTADALAARVLTQEHLLYPRAIRWFLDGQLVIEGGKVRVKGSHAQLVASDRA